MMGGTPLQFGKVLVFFGIIFIILGVLWIAGSKVSFFGFGRLPGDIAYKGKNFQFYFPIVSCLVLSVVLTLVFWVVSILVKRP